MKSPLCDINNDTTLPKWVVEHKSKKFYEKRKELLNREKKISKRKRDRRKIDDLYKEKQIRHTLTFNGRTQSLIDWCKELKIGRSTMCYRLKKGWSIEKIFFQGKFPTNGVNDTIPNELIDEGVESWQMLMAMRGFSFRKERLQAYKQLKVDYDMLRKQGLQVAA
jgi:hypothetical protein